MANEEETAQNRRAGRNANLHRANTEKNDEFYTTYEEVEKELNHYAKQFNNKVIYCNCDDHYGIGLGTPKSQFIKYLADNFEAFGIKKVIATHYEPEKTSTMYILDKDNTGDGIICWEDIEEIKLKGNGDFRSDECIKLLQQADIVITNPPFSLFREYVAQLYQYNKKFLIIGNMNAITYKEIFPLIKENKLWFGYGFNRSMVFKTQYKNTLEANRKFVISKGYNPDDNYIKTPAVCWFTNLENIKHQELINTGKQYYGFEEMYPHYDNYDAIEVSEVKNIPMDYDGIMGVPITFLDKHNPEQFEIIGCADYTGKYGSDWLCVGRIGETWMKKYREQGGRGHYTANMTSLVYYDNNGNAIPTFKRILIKRKK
ncbi:MAG: modification methylase [Alphaproteobacteria bacterium]|nr:modification methylase [Alphaproteobacteria bacterium]